MTIGLSGQVMIRSDALDRWNARWGETTSDYIEAARRAHPQTLGGKEVQIALGPSGEIECFVEGRSVTHLVGPVIETIRQEKIARIPVAAGIYDASNAANGRTMIEQQGANATISTQLKDGRQAVLRGRYQEVTRQDGSKAIGFFGPLV